MTEDQTGVRVVNNSAEHRYEAWVGDRRAGFAAYEERPGHLIFTHTEVDAAFKGHGTGQRLAAAALDDVRDRGFTLTPQCPFVAAFIQQRPEYSDLVGPRKPVR